MRTRTGSQPATNRQVLLRTGNQAPLRGRPAAAGSTGNYRQSTGSLQSAGIHNGPAGRRACAKGGARRGFLPGAELPWAIPWGSR